MLGIWLLPSSVAITNTHEWCWIRCSNILERFSVPCLCGLVYTIFILLRKLCPISWWCVWRFLKMFLLFRSYHICKIYFQKRFWKIYFLKNICFNIFLKRIFDSNICVSRRKIFFQWIFLFVKYIFKRDFGKYIFWRIFVSTYFWREYLIQIYV